MPNWAELICLDPAQIFRSGLWTCLALSVTGAVPNILGTDTLRCYDISLSAELWASTGGVHVAKLIGIPNYFHICVHPTNAYRWWSNGSQSLITRRISGKIYYDENQNGLKDTNEIYLPGQKVRLLPYLFTSFTNSSGEYDIDVDTGNYTIQYISQGIWSLSSSTPSYHAIVDTANITIPDFGAKARDTSITGLVQSSGVMRCHSTTSFFIACFNHGTQVENGISGMFSDVILPTSSFTPMYDSTSNGWYFWNINNLLYGGQRGFNVIIETPGPSYLGNTITSIAIFKTSGAFLTDTLRQVFLCSHDPNDKTVYPTGKGPEHYTLMNETLRYTIRFQNTGNDTAFNITIKDTLSPWLDVNSFQFLASSHSVNTNLKASGALSFRFDNILLPDSGHSQELSQGYITYSVKPRTSLPNNTEIKNTSYIFFDYNPAVQTNTTLSTMVYTMPSGIEENKPSTGCLNVFPNPSDGQVKISAPAGYKNLQLSIFNAQGQVIFESQLSDNTLDIKLPEAGLYLIKAYNEKEVWTQKVIVIY